MVNLTAAFLTDLGLVREINEDSAWAQVYRPLFSNPIGLFIVCDGMGGHMGGEFASYWAIEALKRELAELMALRDPLDTVILPKDEDGTVRLEAVTPKSAADIDLEARVQGAIQKANQVVYEYARHKPESAADAGTTLTMALVQGRKAVIANIGDSRTYLLRKHQLQQVTTDHSLVGNLVASGQIAPQDIYTHPRRNVIYRFLGQKGEAKPDLFRLQLENGDYLLLCSDGLWEMVRSDERMAQIIEEAVEPDLAVRRLIEAANAGGGEDNIGVVVVKVS